MHLVRLHSDLFVQAHTYTHTHIRLEVTLGLCVHRSVCNWILGTSLFAPAYLEHMSLLDDRGGEGVGGSFFGTIFQVFARFMGVVVSHRLRSDEWFTGYRDDQEHLVTSANSPLKTSNPSR
jgi:hypothetical protein